MVWAGLHLNLSRKITYKRGSEFLFRVSTLDGDYWILGCCSGARSWSRQKELSRLVFVKRALMYHSNRVHMYSLYRRRSELDDRLLVELAELSMSSYTRIRRLVILWRLQVVAHWMSDNQSGTNCFPQCVWGMSAHWSWVEPINLMTYLSVLYSIDTLGPASFVRCYRKGRWPRSYERSLIHLVEQGHWWVWLR